MPDAEVRYYSEAVEMALAKGRALTANAVMRLRDAMTMIGMRIQARAQERTPRDSGTLMRSARTISRRSAADWLTEITFGGLASKYAEVQHENPEYTHTSAAWRARYGAVIPRRRFPGGHKGGQDHFLHGAGNSAWNRTSQRWAAMTLDRASQIILAKELGA